MRETDVWTCVECGDEIEVGGYARAFVDEETGETSHVCQDCFVFHLIDVWEEQGTALLMVKAQAVRQLMEQEENELRMAAFSTLQVIWLHEHLEELPIRGEG
ncbi:MAG: hypothetical protein R3C15_19705 [Thermoleophilia bacterium]